MRLFTFSPVPGDGASLSCKLHHQAQSQNGTIEQQSRILRPAEPYFYHGLSAPESGNITPRIVRRPPPSTAMSPCGDGCISRHPQDIASAPPTLDCPCLRPQGSTVALAVGGAFVVRLRQSSSPSYRDTKESWGRQTFTEHKLENGDSASWKDMMAL